MFLTLNNNTYMANLVQTDEALDRLLRLLEKESLVVVDLETTGLRWFLGDRIAGVAILLPSILSAYYVPFRHGEGFNFPLERLSDLLWKLSSHETTYIGWNFKFDLHFMRNEGASVYDMAEVEDVMYALHLLDENRKSFGKNYKLKDVATEFLDPKANASDIELQHKLAARGLKKGVMSMLPAVDVAEYAMYDVILTWELRQFFMPYLEKWGVVGVYQELNAFMQHAILRMEANGMVVDRNQIMEAIEHSKIEAEQKLKEIQAAAGYPLNPNSPSQVAAWLAIDNSQRKTLEAMKDDRAELVIDYKFLTKAAGTFFEPYLYWSSGDGRIHPSLHVTGTVSGRLSSSEPNLQQVPRKPKAGSRGYNVKDVFVAPDGYVVAQFDYKAQELRLAAFYSGEPTITETFNAGGDPHQITANTLGIDRQSGKTMNFGLLYGMGIEKFMAYAKISDYEEAERLHKGWHKLYPAFKSAHYQVTRICEAWRNPDGTPAPDWKGFRYLRLPDKRVRHFNGDDPQFFSGWNTLIQGTGAIIMRRALMKLCQRYRPDSDEVIPVMTVHDSFIAYVKDNENKASNLRTIKAIMEDFDEYNPRMEVEVAVGSTWGSVKEVKGL